MVRLMIFVRCLIFDRFRNLGEEICSNVYTSVRGFDYSEIVNTSYPGECNHQLAMNEGFIFSNKNDTYFIKCSSLGLVNSQGKSPIKIKLIWWDHIISSLVC